MIVKIQNPPRILVVEPKRLLAAHMAANNILLTLNASVEHLGWERAFPQGIEPFCDHVLQSAWQEACAAWKFKTALGEVSLLLTGDEELQALNRDYRGKDKPTNVLSFPACEDARKMLKASEEELPLGDIAMAYETIVHEAREQGKTIPQHTAHMMVHGLLHLLGYDHESDVDATAMEALEVRILQKLDYPNPYDA